MNKNKGITLIALVITIIILIILAGISVATLTGDNGLFSRAKQAKENTEEARNLENTILGEYENKIDKLTDYKNEQDEEINENTVLFLNGEDFTDSSLNKYNNIINNNVIISENGKKGKCFYFNDNGYFKLENTNLIDVNKDFSIELWAKFSENPSSYSTLFRIGGNNDSSAMCAVGLYILNDRLYLMTNGGGRGWDISSTSTTFEIDKWTHIAIVKKYNEMYLYKDGHKVGTRTFVGNLDTTQLNFFGKDCDIGVQYFKGYLDEIRIFNIARWTEDNIE